MSGVDLLGSSLSPAEERLLAVYEQLKALCADDDLPPIAAANVRAALALMHNVVNGLALKYEHLSDRGSETMRIAVVGGGPSGLYFSILIRRLRPDCSVTVFERNRATDAFGFGVVFSDETLTVFENADPESFAAIASRFARWTDIDIHHRGTMTRSGGHGFAALGRRELLGILQRRAMALGVELVFEAEAPAVSELGWADLIVGADGASSAVRTSLYRDFVPSLEPRHCRYMWLGVELVYDAFKFFIAETEHGVFQAHAYPYDDHMSTFIVETHESVWAAAGLGSRASGALAPGESDLAGVAFCEELFADALEGRAPIANNSKWINFVTVRNRRWCADNVVLLGDAAHTAHFSIGSGTKLAMEDAAALAWAFREPGADVWSALSRTRPSGGRWWSQPSARRRRRLSGSRGCRGTSGRSEHGSRSTC